MIDRVNIGENDRVNHKVIEAVNVRMIDRVNIGVNDRVNEAVIEKVIESNGRE